MSAGPLADTDPPMTMATSVPSQAQRAGVDTAVVIAGCLVFALVMFLPPILNDGDTLWQIRTGIWILHHHAVPSTDPFSFTAGARPWFAHEWLAETLLGVAFLAGGMPGVMVLTAAASGLTAAIVLHHLRRFLPAIYALTALILAFCAAAPSMLARPHLLAWPCLALWCGGLVAARADRRAPSLALLPVMLLWVNLHGSFMLGLLLPGALMIEALFDPGADRRRVAISWGGFILAAWAVALLNPDFLAGLLFPFRLLQMQNLARIGEWTPTDFSRPQPLEVIILASIALGLSGKVRVPPMRLLLFLGLIHMALTHGRNQQLVGLVGTLILAEPLGRSLAPGGVLPAPARSRGLASGAVALALIALVARMLLPLSPDRTGAAFAAVLDRIPPALRAKPVLNDYAYGGALIFAGVRPFIDGRADLYGDGFLDDYRKITSPNRADLDRALSRYGIAWTIFPAGAPIVGLLDAEPGWRRLVETDGIVIQARQGQ